MSRAQNGTDYHSTHTHPPPASNTSYGRQGLQAPQSDMRRSSFDAGDDAQFNDEPPPASGQAPAHPYGFTDNRQDPANSFAYRASYQNPPLAGYQHYQQSISSPTTYNPASFPPQPQYNPQSYASPTATSFPTSPFTQQRPYQPYVPAAYSASNAQTSQAPYYNHNQSPQLPYQNAPVPPPPPPRTQGSHYGQQQSSYGAYQHEPRYQPQYASPHTQQQYVGQQQPYSSAPAPPSHDPRMSGMTSMPSYDNSQPDRSSSLGDITPPSSQMSPQRMDTLSRHPQSRPLPGPPSESESDGDYFSGHDARQPAQGRSGVDDLMKQINEEIDATSPGNHGRRTSSRQPTSPQLIVTPDETPTHVNGNIATDGEHNINYGAFSDDSDAEAAAGLAALEEAERQDAAEEARRRSGSAQFSSHRTSFGQQIAARDSSHDVSSDSDYGNVDMGALGGGYEGHLAYGEPYANYAGTASMPQGDYERLNTRMSSMRSSGVSSEGRESQTSGYESIPTFDAIHPFPPFNSDARVDTGGTGGLTEPSPHPRRLSYEDGDEGQFGDYENERTSGRVSPSRDSMHSMTSMQDLFFHPGPNPQRPLPPPPSMSDPGIRLPYSGAGPGSASYNRLSQYEQVQRPYLAAQESYQQPLLSPSNVPRSTSLSSTRSVPRTDHPIRSKTDADRAKLLKAQMSGRPMSEGYDTTLPPSTTPLDLPAIPKKRFNSSKITSEQFRKCTEPWALSSVLTWIRDLADEETDLKEHAVAEGIVNLFTNKVPTMNTADAEVLGDHAVKLMIAAGALIKEEEWVKFGSGDISGVLYQLTGTGCYSPKLHVYHTKGRCYSHYCMRTLKKVDLSLPVEAEKKTEDWVTFYKLKKEDYESVSKKEIERQNILHEVVTGEDSYINHLDVLRLLYRDQIATTEIVPGKRKEVFLNEVFGHVDRVKKVNEDFLLAQMKYRQNEQGPWIVGFSDIFREWIRRARSIYVEYAANYPRADYLMRTEGERNLHFKNFLDQAREDRRSNRLAWDSFLKEPITRIQRYTLLLQTIQKTMVKDSEEKTNLQFALDEVRAATFECNAKYAEMERKMVLIELQRKIRLRKGMDKEVELNLDHLGREILLRGDLQRAGGKGFAWVDTHAILFDHYLVLAKTIIHRDSAGGKRSEVYDVSKVPIPMDLIMLESANDDPVVKSSVKGIGAVTTAVTPRGHPAADPRLARTTSAASGGPGTLIHTNTSNSIGSGKTAMVASTVLEGKDEKIMYPFRVRHLGKSEVYTLYAPSAQNRQDWADAIIEAKTRHAAALYAQNAEPFRLRVLADTAFAYDSMTAVAPLRIVIKGTPIDRAIREAEKSYAGQPRPQPVCRAAVNCATVFNQPYGRLMCAVGTDFGVFISEYHNPRGWNRAITLSRVTQVAVFEEFNLFLLIADKSLIAYHLDVVCPISASSSTNPSPNHNPSTSTATDASGRKAPQKLSGAKDVGFFATGRQKDRALVFYKKRDGLNSTFKVLEPILQKSASNRSRFGLSSAFGGSSGGAPSSRNRGQTEFFREYDEFYIPAECYSINLFNTSLAISTARGVEVLTLDKKQPWSVPNLRGDTNEAQAHLTSIASRIKDLKPLGMFRLGEAEFLVAFEECAVYVNKLGDISRGVVMEFVGRAKAASLYGMYLILFDDDFVEIRDAMNGRLKQVVGGKDIRLLDDGGNHVVTGTPVGTPGAGVPAMGQHQLQPQQQQGSRYGTNGTAMGFAGPPGSVSPALGGGQQQRTVKFVMQHPEYERSHVLLELVENGPGGASASATAASASVSGVSAWSGETKT